MRELQIAEVVYKDPVDKRDNAEAEYAVLQMERAVKRMMTQVSAPVQYFCYFTTHAAFVLSRLPLNRNICKTSGNTKQPIEELTCGMISREECDGDLGWIIPPCSLALLPRKSSKGSDIHAVDRCDWGIALGHEGH
eukprot:SAG11_NODE_16432_length_547_cov_1.640625_1_plen_135_part_01